VLNVKHRKQFIVVVVVFAPMLVMHTHRSWGLPAQLQSRDNSGRFCSPLCGWVL
jgi:predicted metal-dependent enzyme (double-stranded beta helix superfamily)